MRRIASVSVERRVSVANYVSVSVERSVNVVIIESVSVSVANYVSVSEMCSWNYSVLDVTAGNVGMAVGVSAGNDVGVSAENVGMAVDVSVGNDVSVSAENVGMAVDVDRPWRSYSEPEETEEESSRCWQLLVSRIASMPFFPVFDVFPLAKAIIGGIVILPSSTEVE